MSDKLEKVLDLLINEQKDEAESLLHEWFVEKARNIHQELVAEDDHVFDDEDLDDEGFDVNDAKDEINAEEYFSDHDLAEDEDMDSDEASDDLEADMDSDVDMDDVDSDEDVDVADDDLDVGSDDVDSDEDLSDKVDDLEAELEALKAEFDALTSDEDLDSEDDIEDVDSDDDLDLDDVDSDDEDLDLDDDSDEESDDAEDEDYTDLGEGILDTLNKIDVSNEADEIGDGKKVDVNKTSPIPQKKVSERTGAKGVTVKNDQHNGFDRETAPEAKKGNGSKKARNVRDSATDEMSEVAKEGDKNAMLNKQTSKPNNKSPLGSK